MDAPVSRSSTENSRPEACYFPITRIGFKLKIPKYTPKLEFLKGKTHSNRENTWKMKKMTVFLTIGIFLTAMKENSAG